MYVNIVIVIAIIHYVTLHNNCGTSEKKRVFILLYLIFIAKNNNTQRTINMPLQIQNTFLP